MNEHIYFEIQAEDIQRAIQFYRKVFGWQFTKTEGLPLEYWRIETGGSRGGLGMATSLPARRRRERLRRSRATDR